MAFNITPSAWVSGYTGNSTSATFPIASIPQLSVAEAATTTGDIRAIIYAMCEKHFQTYNALATADKSTKMVVGKSTFVNDAAGETTATFTFAFKVASTGTDVVPE